MKKANLSIDDEFIVKEEKILNYILAVLFFALFIYGIINLIINHFKDYAGFVLLLTLAPAIFFIRKGNSRRIYIRINKNGIYQEEKLITGWKYFLNAYVDQRKMKNTGEYRLSQTKMTSPIQDNFELNIEYMKPGLDKGFRKKIPLTNTQNKSEEDVLAAIMFFWKDAKKVR